jgi:hypothetical protein
LFEKATLLIIGRFKQLIQDVHAALKESFNALSSVKHIVEKLVDIRKCILAVEPQTASIFFKTFEVIQGSILALCNEINGALSALFNESELVEDQCLLIHQHIQTLQNCSWVDQYIEGVVSKAIEGIEERVRTQAERLLARFKNVSSSLTVSSPTEATKSFISFVSRLKHVNSLQSLIPKLDAICTPMFDELKSVQGRVQAQVEALFTVDHLMHPDLLTVANCLNFLEICSKSICPEVRSLEKCRETIIFRLSELGKKIDGTFKSSFGLLDRIQGFEESNQHSEMILVNSPSEIVAVVFNCIEKINLISLEFPQLMQLIMTAVPDLDAKPLARVQQFTSHLERTCHQLHLSGLDADLRTMAHVARELVRFDVLFANVNDKFQGRYLEIARLVQNRIDAQFESVRGEIKDERFDSAILGLDSLSEDHVTHRDLIHLLNASLCACISRITATVGCLSHQENSLIVLIGIVDKLRELENVLVSKSSCKWISQATKTKLEQCVESSKVDLYLLLEKALQGASVAFSVLDFDVAHERLSRANRLVGLIGQYCDPTQQLAYGNSDGMLEKCLISLLERYRQKKVQDYTSPTDDHVEVFRRLQTAESYRNVLDVTVAQLHSIVRDTFVAEIQAVGTNNAIVDPSADKVQEIEVALLALPNGLKNAILPKFREMIRLLHLRTNTLTGNLSHCLAWGEFSKAKELLAPYVSDLT